MKAKKFKRALTNSLTSNVIKSTRRIFFNHLEESVEQRGHFHVDQFFGAGTGILIKKSELFYLLTANHVIQSATKYKFNNDSPFWITAKSEYKVESIYDYLMPAKILHIGETIQDLGISLDMTDIVLVEMFSPMPLHQPDHFVNLDDKISPFLSKEKYYEGQLLLAAGYPFERNNFEFYDEPKDGFTHETNINRNIVQGVCLFDRGEPYMTLEPISNTNYQNMSGASGGIISNVQPKSNQAQVLGMLISGGPKIIRFIPTHILQKAINNMHSARITVVDPSITRAPDLNNVIAVLEQYSSRFLKINP
jgi:hypothetical protein